MTAMGKTILLVDDEILIAVNRAELLERNGYLVMTATNAKQAIDKVESGVRIDLILMDINLGKGMDGTQAAEEILKDHDIPIVFLSNYTEAEIVKKTDKVVSYGYIVKDSGDTVLLTSIKMAFRLYETQRDLKEREAKLKTTLQEKERIETQLLKEQENFIKMFSAAPVGLLLLDENSIISKSNKAVSNMVLRDPADIIGKRAGGGLGCIHSMETPDGCGFSDSCPDCVLRKSIEDVLKDGSSINGAIVKPTLLINGEMQEHWLIVNAEPVELNGSRNVIVAIEDISDQKRAEQALEESQHFVQSILEAAPNLIYTYDLKEKKNTYANRDLLEFLGYSSEKIRQVGEKILANVIHHDDAMKVAGHHEKFSSGKGDEVFEVEYRLKRSDGQWRWVRSRDVLFSRDEQGKPRQILGSAEDITERKRMEEDLKRALDRKS